ncbi:MAG: hypothetical protein COX19_07335 [Desulfobacterales bacterium CG23_combo_of_CG06-09_8_20_14_all_51_8]|nr:MAG: hypothetical protein COX19_07335 [Desulfobacterales bacterium CG23_combo_of_CG06-09_8_20_14_all_51_8]
MGNPMDRRMHQRFRVRDASFAYIENGAKILCKIKNISKGGVSLITIANAEKIPEVFDTDIFIAGRVFYLKDIPSKKISEAKVDSKGFFMPFVKSRVSVQFQRMSKEQADQLAFFLKTHATIEDISEA